MSDDCQEKHITFAAMIVTSIIFLLTTLAGGALFNVLGKRGIHDMSHFMAFGGAFIIGMSFLHLLPEAFAATSNAGLFVLLGFVVQIFLEFLSNGIEHGHHHPHHHTADCHDKPVLNRIPWLAFLSLALHAILESMPVIEHGHDHYGHVHGPLALDMIDWSLVTGLVLHKVPVAMVLMAMMIGEHVPQKWAWALLVMFGLCPSVGMAAFDWMFHNMETVDGLAFAGAMQGCVVGILMHIGTVVLFEAGEGHHFHPGKLIAVLVGLGLSVAAFL